MRVSIIMPVLDGEAYIGPAIRSLVNQTHPPAEVLVCDNGSTDGSAGIARGFGPPVRVVAAPEPGAAAARNAGIAEATGEAIMFFDCDDLLGPTALEELTAALAVEPGAIACCPWRRFELVDGVWRVRPASTPPRRRGDDALASWLGGWYHPPCSVLWSREAVERIGGFDPAIGVNDDGDAVMRALAAGTPLVRTAGGEAFYRRHPGEGTSLSGARRSRKGLLSELAVADKIAGELAGRGKAEAYAGALGRAYRAIADAAGDEPDLAARSLDAARVHRNAAGIGPMLGRIVQRGDAMTPMRLARAAPRPAPAAGVGTVGTPLVSVIIPTYNRARLTLRALEGVRAQSWSALEIVVVDDASTDGTADTVAALDDPRIRVLRQPANRGVAAARNRGIAESRGAFVAFLDSDDRWIAADKIERQMALFAASGPRLGLVHGGLVELTREGERRPWRPSVRGDAWRPMLEKNVLHYSTSSVVVRREAIETTGGFDETLPAAEDYDLWTRIARFWEIDFVPEPVIEYDNRGEESGERRSRRFAANIAARGRWVTDHGADARRAGMLDAVHLATARRHVESPEGSIGAARRELLKAIRANPTAPRLHAWLAFTLLPGALRDGALPRLAGLRRRLPERLWSGERAVGR